MDSISHAAFGASWSQSASRKKIVVAGVVSAVAAMAPDLDTLIQSPTDPLLFLEYHREFTHALSFAPFGALLCAGAFYWFVRARLTFLEIYLCCFLGYGSHLLLDACTTYGTQLLWPFSDARIAWAVIAVLDPFFTVPVVVLVVLAGLKRQPRYARIALICSVAYVGLGALQNLRATAAGEELARSRNHVPVRLEAMPALGSLLLWKVIYEYDGRYYVDAVRAGLAVTAVYPGENVAKLDLARDYPWLAPSSQQALDVERFRKISADFLTVDDDAPNRVVDLRYSMVPNEIEGFWAIVLDPSAAPTEHVEFVMTRERAPEQALRLLDMLF